MPGVKGRSGGRNAKTVAAHTLTGTYRRDRHGDRRNPEPPVGAPDRPRDLRGAAAAEWDRVVADLVRSGSIATVDGAALRNYVELHATAERLQREVNALAQLSSNDRVHPAVAQLRQYRLALRLYLVEFGLTPAARSRVQLAPAPPPDDEFAEFDRPFPPRRLPPVEAQ